LFGTRGSGTDARRMARRKESGAIRKPGTSFPVYFLILRNFRFWNDQCFTGVDELEVDAFRVAIGQVFPIRRNRTTFDGVLERICGELSLFEFRLCGWMRNSQPENDPERNQRHGNCRQEWPASVQPARLCRTIRTPRRSSPTRESLLRNQCLAQAASRLGIALQALQVSPHF